jgi:hypothetical protein
MSLRATVITACIAALGAGVADLRADPPDRDRALEALRKMIAPSPEAERDYAIALEIWQRENAGESAPAEPRQEAPGQ